MQTAQDTIAAVATAQGRGGIGIIRVSGPAARRIAQQIGKLDPVPRHAHYRSFFTPAGETIDQGLLLFFPAPHSFTGEDVLELQGHGGPVVLDMLLQSCFELGARPARPGEFSERAFLNDRLDLAQAEAIADLIDASSRQAARNALRTLQGEFSQKVHELTEQLIQLRMYIEAAIDFPEEEVDFLSDGHIQKRLEQLRHRLESVLQAAGQGVLLQNGMTVVIAGRPNAGKSSLLNALSGQESAIVTDIAGTTRDILKEHIHIDGMPLHLVDTAGLRATTDQVEQIGVSRAVKAIRDADRILLISDATRLELETPLAFWSAFMEQPPEPQQVIRIRNKADLTGEPPTLQQTPDGLVTITLSASTGAGLDLLREHLKQCMKYGQTAETTFSARQRHVQALQKAATRLLQGQVQFIQTGAGELLAEDLRAVQQNLDEITGTFSSDDLLNRIFSGFCIGK